MGSPTPRACHFRSSAGLSRVSGRTHAWRPPGNSPRRWGWPRPSSSPPRQETPNPPRGPPRTCGRSVPLSRPHSPRTWTSHPPSAACVRDWTRPSACTPVETCTGMVDLLPRLIRDSHALVSVNDEGRAVRSEVMQIAGRLMTQTRNYAAADLAFEAVERDAPDEVHGAALANNRCWLLLRRGRLAEASDLAIRWADDLEPRLSRATAGELSAWGAGSYCGSPRPRPGTTGRTRPVWPCDWRRRRRRRSRWGPPARPWP